MFWQENWRKKLCTKECCKAVYAPRGVSYLLEEEDTVQAYEERGRKRRCSSDYDRGMEALGSMERPQQVEMIHGFNNLKDGLKGFLRGFAERNEVVKEEDIRAFFEQMQAKRQKTGGSGMSY